MSQIVIASDHAGFALKQVLVAYLNTTEHSVIDCGTHSADSVDYPEFAQALAGYIPNKASIGILVCGSGIGMSIAANRFKHLRAALCFDREHARLARGHNNANVLCLGSRFLGEAEAIKLIETFLDTEFEGGRHQRRIEKLS